ETNKAPQYQEYTEFDSHRPSPELSPRERDVQPGMGIGTGMRITIGFEKEEILNGEGGVEEVVIEDNHFGAAQSAIDPDQQRSIDPNNDRFFNDSAPTDQKHTQDDGPVKVGELSGEDEDHNDNNNNNNRYDNDNNNGNSNDNNNGNGIDNADNTNNESKDQSKWSGKESEYFENDNELERDKISGLAYRYSHGNPIVHSLERLLDLQLRFSDEPKSELLGGDEWTSAYVSVHRPSHSYIKNLDWVSFSAREKGDDVDEHEDEKKRGDTRMTLRPAGNLKRNIRPPQTHALQEDKDSHRYQVKMEHQLLPDERLIKKVRGILNKITPEKFDVLAKRMISLVQDDVTNQDQYALVLSSILDKAATENKFVEQYVELCVELYQSRLKPLLKLMKMTNDMNATRGTASGNDGTDEKKQNRSAQKEFRRMCIEFLQTKLASQRIQVLENIDEMEEFQSMDKEDVDNIKIARKKKLLGFMSVLGELYNRDLISENIIFDGVIPNYLGKKDSPPLPLDIESLCALLEQCCVTLEDNPSAKRKAEECLNKMHLWARDMEPRIRFRVDAICEIKNNQWVNPHKTDKAKTLREIRQEFFKQQQKQSSRTLSSNKSSLLHSSIPADIKRGRSDGSHSSRGSFYYLFISLSIYFFVCLFVDDEKIRSFRSYNDDKEEEEEAEAEEQEQEENNDYIDREEDNTVAVDGREDEGKDSRNNSDCVVIAEPRDDLSNEELVKTVQKYLRAQALETAEGFVMQYSDRWTGHMWTRLINQVCQEWSPDEVKTYFVSWMETPVTKGWLSYSIVVDIGKELGKNFEFECVDIPMLPEFYGATFATMAMHGAKDNFVVIFKDFVITVRDTEAKPKTWMAVLRHGLKYITTANHQNKDSVLTSFRSLKLASLLNSNFLQ
ncbi:eukaryotic translation initiation factor 4 gamma, partial [Reticulomyxa filosa]